jgi:hypothetical protein
VKAKYGVASPRGVEELTRKDLERVVDQTNRALMDIYGSILPAVEGVPTVEIINLGDTVTTTITNIVTDANPLEEYVAGSVPATGWVNVIIDGVTYKLLASTGKPTIADESGIAIDDESGVPLDAEG